jgi:hypothetical protein
MQASTMSPMSKIMCKYFPFSLMNMKS